VIADTIEKTLDRLEEEILPSLDYSVSYAEISRLTGNGVSRSHVRNVLCGICKPSDQIALQIAEALGMQGTIRSKINQLQEFVRKHIEFKSKSGPKYTGKRKNKVSYSVVWAIRDEPEGITTRELAEKYGVSRTSVSNIRRKDHLGGYVVYKSVASS